MHNKETLPGPPCQGGSLCPPQSYSRGNCVLFVVNNFFYLYDYIISIHKNFFIGKPDYGVSHLLKESCPVRVTYDLTILQMITAIYLDDYFLVGGNEITYIVAKNVLSEKLCPESIAPQVRP